MSVSKRLGILENNKILQRKMTFMTIMIRMQQDTVVLRSKSSTLDRKVGGIPPQSTFLLKWTTLTSEERKKTETYLRKLTYLALGLI